MGVFVFVLGGVCIFTLGVFIMKVYRVEQLLKIYVKASSAEEAKKIACNRLLLGGVASRSKFKTMRVTPADKSEIPPELKGS